MNKKFNLDIISNFILNFTLNITKTSKNFYDWFKGHIAQNYVCSYTKLPWTIWFEIALGLFHIIFMKNIILKNTLYLPGGFVDASTNRDVSTSHANFVQMPSYVLLVVNV